MSQELESQIESLNQQIADMKKAGEQSVTAVTAKEKEITDLKAQLAASPAAVNEDLKKKADRAAELETSNKQLLQKLLINDLQKKYPDADMTLVPAGTPEEMDAYAAKLQASIGIAVKKYVPAPPPPGGGNPPANLWEKLPGGLSDDEENRRKTLMDQSRAETDAAVKAGDPVAALNGLLKPLGGADKAFGIKRVVVSSK